MLDDYLTDNISKSEFSVSEISSRIKFLLENNLGVVRVKGEISGLKIASSGHGYFSLKDEGAILAATCWRHSLASIGFKLEEGLEIIVTGKITAYAGQSKYQISVTAIEPSGIGAFMKILDERRKKLEAEGLFAADRKQKIPFLPGKIGIITSMTGAVIKDIIHRITDRCPTRLIIWPVAVQGENSAAEIANAIASFNNVSADIRPNLLIVARGGGSIEDLWSFNEEIVVRAVYDSSIPIISAVGHETDYTLIDLASDLRAPTPTAAAEFAVPVISELKYTLNFFEQKLTSRLFDFIKYYREKLNGNIFRLQQIGSFINNHVQRLDDVTFRLTASLPNLLTQKQLKLQYFSTSRLKPARILNYKFLQYQNVRDNLVNRKTIALTNFEHRLSLNAKLLSSLDYHSVLTRGFAMVKDTGGKIISSLGETENSKELIIKMHDKEILVTKI